MQLELVVTWAPVPDAVPRGLEGLLVRSDRSWHGHGWQLRAHQGAHHAVQQRAAAFRSSYEMVWRWATREVAAAGLGSCCALLPESATLAELAALVSAPPAVSNERACTLVADVPSGLVAATAGDVASCMARGVGGADGEMLETLAAALVRAGGAMRPLLVVSAGVS